MHTCNEKKNPADIAAYNKSNPELFTEIIIKNLEEHTYTHTDLLSQLRL